MAPGAEHGGGCGVQHSTSEDLAHFKVGVRIALMIYLDNNATTRILPEVLEAMMPYLTSEWGNPSSSYNFGSRLKGPVEVARAHVADLIGAHASEIIFTSCATESNNAAVRAALKANPAKHHVITSTVEHSSVLNCCAAVEKEGYRVTYLPVDRNGLLSPSDLENAITSETGLVTLMWANNETGVIFPVKEIAEICHSRGVLYHCDAVQAAGKLAINVDEIPVDYLSLTGHKFHAPKGIGTLYVRRKAPFSPLICGGHQERNRRAGTESIPLIVALGKAAELARRNVDRYAHQVRPLRDELEDHLLTGLPDVERNGDKTQRIANTSNISFGGIESEALLILLDQEGVCASSGAACLADSTDPSHVITAMKPDSGASSHAIRFSLSEDTCADDVRKTIMAVRECVGILRGG